MTMVNIKLIPCPACRTSVSSQAITCPRCGQPIGNRSFAQSAQGNGAEVNDSGQGSSSALPTRLQGFNWGALLFGPIWSIFNNTWIGLLALVPGLGLVMHLILGIKGSEWSWQNKRWDSIEHFYGTQRNWALWGFILIAISFALGLILYLGMGLRTMPNR